MYQNSIYRIVEQGDPVLIYPIPEKAADSLPIMILIGVFLASSLLLGSLSVYFGKKYDHGGSFANVSLSILLSGALTALIGMAIVSFNNTKEDERKDWYYVKSAEILSKKSGVEITGEDVRISGLHSVLAKGSKEEVLFYDQNTPDSEGKFVQEVRMFNVDGYVVQVEVSRESDSS